MPRPASRSIRTRTSFLGCRTGPWTHSARSCSAPRPPNAGRFRRPGPESAPRANETRTTPLGVVLFSAPLRVFRGAGDETRTRDSLLGRQVLYQLSYPRVGLK